MHDDGSKDKQFKQFQTIAASALLRFYRQRHADAALFRLMAANAAFLLAEATATSPNEGIWQEVFKNHRRVKREGLDHLDSLYAENTIISALSVMDSFLSDLTRFLLLMHPAAISKERQIKFGDVLEANDLGKVIGAAVDKFVHELSYKRLSERIDYLQQGFGIDLSTSRKLVETVQSFADLRNRLVHDTSMFMYSAASKTGKLEVLPKSHGQQVQWETADQVLDRCDDLVDAIFLAASKHFFKREPEVRLRKKIEDSVITKK
jgi:hypothetical protein